jgi:hypothetical protein
VITTFLKCIAGENNVEILNPPQEFSRDDADTWVILRISRAVDGHVHGTPCDFILTTETDDDGPWGAPEIRRADFTDRPRVFDQFERFPAENGVEYSIWPQPGDYMDHPRELKMSCYKLIIPRIGYKRRARRSVDFSQTVSFFTFYYRVSHDLVILAGSYCSDEHSRRRRTREWRSAPSAQFDGTFRE